jgi:hypothetical protein
VHFPTHSGTTFVTDELTNDKYLVDTGATLSIKPHNSDNKPSGPLLKGENDLPIPSWGFLTKAVQFQRKLFTFCFLQAAVAGPILGLNLKKNSKSLLLLILAKSFLRVPQRPRLLPLPFCLAFLATTWETCATGTPQLFTPLHASGARFLGEHIIAF